MCLKTKLLLLTTIVLNTAIFSQSIDKDRLDLYFKTLEENNKVSGTVLISKSGKKVYSKSIGYAKVDSNIKNSDSTKYRIGSITKMFTAVMILKAVEQGKISLDQTIDKYFPSLVFGNKIKIRHLLNHRSGLVNFTNFQNYANYNTKTLTRAELLDTILMYGSERLPDIKTSYSNTNYVLLTFILQNIYNTRFQNCIKDSIIIPLKLENTYVGTQIDSNKNESYSYIFDSVWKKQNETDMSIPLGAGAIVSNPIDLDKFIKALFSYKLINKQSLEYMKTIVEGHGSGIFKYPYYEKWGYGHTGGIDGFSSFLFYLPEEELTICYTFNSNIYDNNKIMLTLLNSYYGKAIEIPSLKNLESSIEERESYIGTYSGIDFPLKITIKNSPYFLIAQATGQPSFTLDKKAKDIYVFEQAGIEIHFNTIQNSLILYQAGEKYELKKIVKQNR